MALVDGIVIGTILLSGLIAMYLGFIRVVSGLGGWVGAAIAAVYGFSYVRPIARQWISDTLIADAAAALGLFIVALIFFSFISHAISKRVRESGLRPIDRSVGFAAGLLLGVSIICGIFLLFDKGSEDRSRPDWLQNARTLPLIERTSNFLWSFAPQSIRNGRRTTDRGLLPGSKRDTQRVVKDLINPAPKQENRPERQGYSTKEREEMDRLLRGQ